MSLILVSIGYIPAISFLGLILILLVGLLAMYYCLSRDLCPCSQNEPKQGYEELQIGEENEGMDEYEDPVIQRFKSQQNTPQLSRKGDDTLSRSAQSERGYASDNEVDSGRSFRPAVSAYGDTQGSNYKALKDFSDVGSIRSTGTAKGSIANSVFVGKVFVMAEFFPDVGRVGFSIVEAQSIPSKSKGGAGHARFHVVLLPDKKQRFKTKTLKTPNPVFKETYIFDRLTREDLFRLAVRMRLYGISAVSKEKYIGEVRLQLADLAHAQNHRLETWRDILRPGTPGTMTP